LLVSFTSSDEHGFFKELLYLESDGELGPRDRSKLDTHLASCHECRQEQQEVVRLQNLLEGASIPVDSQFSSRVMNRLPEAGWEARSPAGWRLAIAVFALLGLGSALLALGEGDLSSEMPLVGTALALISLFRSALVAGGGLLAASWTGIGLALDELLGGSRVAFVVFGVLVLGIDLLFLRLLLRQRAARAGTRDDG
jgi:anti-sigma factor RsiW